MMSRKSPHFKAVNVEVTNSMAILQVAANRHIHNITLNCYNHFFHYDTSAQIDDTFSGLSLTALSGVFITFAGLMLCAICAFLAENMLGVNAILKRNHIEPRTEAAGKALEDMMLKWNIRELMYEAGSVHRCS
ncbi:unnamed protein product [Sphagnum balticum]